MSLQRNLQRLWRLCMGLCCACAICYVFRNDPEGAFVSALCAIGFFALAEWYPRD